MFRSGVVVAIEPSQIAFLEEETIDGDAVEDDDVIRMRNPYEIFDYVKNSILNEDDAVSDVHLVAVVVVVSVIAVIDKRAIGG